MFKCAITGNTVSGRLPVRAILQVRPVTYKILLQTNDRIVKQTTGWEIVREALVDPKIVHTLPTIEQLLEKAKSLESVERTEYLKKRPKRVWAPRPKRINKDDYTFRLKIVKKG